jgi:hypothetical protein
MGAGLRLFDVAPDDPGLLMARVEESPARQEKRGE